MWGYEEQGGRVDVKTLYIELRLGMYDVELDQWLDMCETS